jgi:hypothetical protein
MTGLINIDKSFTKTGDDSQKPIRFCSRCGQPSGEPPKRFERRGRVCRHCGMGLMLNCSREALPGAAAAFVIVTYDLSVSAVSGAGEDIFGREPKVVGVPLLDLVTSPVGDDQLAGRVAQAAQRVCDPVVMPVRLLSEKASSVGTMAARIATCGPPRAALVTVEPSEFGRS